MLRVGVVSDTHLPRFGRALPRALVTGLRDARVDRILHLGDWTASFVVDRLAELAPVDGVAGNNDRPELVERFGLVRRIELGGVVLGLTHGHLGAGRSTPERARSLFREGPPVAGILFGHSHIPLIGDPGTTGEPWMLNPGSPTDRRRQPRFSWALLTLDGGRISGAELRTYDDRAV